MNPCRIPFELLRLPESRLRLRNCSGVTLRGLTMITTGRARLIAPVRTILPPGGSVDARLRGRDLARDSTVVVRWIDPDGDEWLWRIVL